MHKVKLSLLLCRRFASALALLLLITPAVFPRAMAQDAPAAPNKDVIVFTNGDSLSGTLLREVGGNIVFKSDMAGEITVPTAKIKEVRTAGSFAVLQHGVPVRESEKVVPAPILITPESVTTNPPNQAEQAGNAQPSASPQPGEAIPQPKVAYVIDAATFNKDLRGTPGFFHGWAGTANLGTTFVQATTHGGTINVGVSLTRQVPVLSFFPPRNRTAVNFQETYGILTQPAIAVTNTPYSQTKTSILHAEAERDEYVSHKAYVLADATFDHNYSQGLDLQQVYGAGVGYTFFSTPKRELDAKFQMQYEKQQFLAAAGAGVPSEPDQNLIASTIAENFRQTLPRKIAFTQTLSILPSWNVPNDYSAHGSVGLALPVYRKLSVSFDATDDFLNNPQPGFQKNSFQFTTGLTYALP